MKLYERILLTIAALLAATAASAELIPIKAWVHDPVIDSVRVSPDGNRLVALTLSDINEPADVTVWDTRDLGKPPARFKPEETKALFVTWLSNDQLFVRGRQKYDYTVGAANDEVVQGHRLSRRREYRSLPDAVQGQGRRYRTGQSVRFTAARRGQDPRRDHKSGIRAPTSTRSISEH